MSKIRTSDQLRRLARDGRAAAAVEFALVVPVFLTVLFGIITYGSYLAVVHGVQQLAAEAARASIAGLSDSERLTLATSNIDNNVSSYALLTPSHLTVQSASTDATGNFTVTLTYDASDMFIFTLPTFVPGLNSTITRSAAIQRGGY